MKKIILATLITISTIGANTLPVLEAGQTISADQLNEMHMALQKSTPEIKSSDLVGSYICRRYAVTGQSGGDSTIGPDGLYTYKDYDVTFSSDGDGTFSSTRDRQMLVPALSYAILETVRYEVVMNIMFIVNNPDTESVERYTIVEDGNKYRFDGDGSINFECTNTKLLSSIATDLTATITNDSVTLTWVDNSTDETGFKILRKDSLTGTYSVIDTVGQDVTTYTDNTLVNGTYWYRVQVSNINGDSLASNVTKVVVAN